MAQNLIRLKQINQSELSGYISDVSNVKLMLPNIVYNTGNQTISGNKTFINNVAVSGTGIFNSLDLNSVDTVSLSGVDVTITNGAVFLTNPLSAPNLVFNTGNQTISGVKTFFNSGVFSNGGAPVVPLLNNPLSVVGSGNSYVQLNIQNRASGTTATADLVITANNGTDNSNFINLGINNSGYNDPTFSNGSGLDGYLFIDGGNLDIGTRTPGKVIEFHAGGTTAANTIARISQSGLSIVSGNLTLQSGSNLVIASGATILGNNYFWFGTGTGASVTTTPNALASFFLESGVAYKLESQLTFAAGTNANTISDLTKNPTTFADGIGFRQGSNNSVDEPNSPLTGYLQLGYSNVNGSIWGSISGRTNHIRKGIIRPTGGNVTVNFTWGSANGSNSRLLENYILLEKIGRI